MDAISGEEWFETGIPGAKFRYNDTVEILSGEHKEKFAAVISLVSLEPEPKYLVELSNGGDVEIVESELLLYSE